MLDTVLFIIAITTMTDAFIPTDYVEPSNSEYLKLEKWTTKVRFLESPIISWEMWEDYTDDEGNEKRRVKRWRKEDKQPIPQGSKLVWTCLVWNYTDCRMQVWSISQKTIRDALVWLARDEDYWNPLNYDIKIKKEWESMQTSYTVNPLPPSKLDDEIKNAMMSTQVNFDMYFEWESPFWQAKDSTEPWDVF